jgi:hypothetical protein
MAYKNPEIKVGQVWTNQDNESLLITSIKPNYDDKWARWIGLDGNTDSNGSLGEIARNCRFNPIATLNHQYKLDLESILKD